MRVKALRHAGKFLAGSPAVWDVRSTRDQREIRIMRSRSRLEQGKHGGNNSRQFNEVIARGYLDCRCRVPGKCQACGRADACGALRHSFWVSCVKRCSVQEPTTAVMHCASACACAAIINREPTFFLPRHPVLSNLASYSQVFL